MYGHQIALSLPTAAAAVRSRFSWNERFEHWERPASDSEEAKIERAARMIRGALDGRDLLGRPHVEVVAQGSYFNNTNTRIESDMDIRADWRESCLLLTAGSIEFEHAQAAFGYFSTGTSTVDIAAAHRVRVWLALCDAFGADQVVPSSKCLKLKPVAGSRAPADLVPTIRCVYAVPAGGGLLSAIPREIEGVAIFDLDGVRTVNFPALHHDNGKQKHANTSRRFKKAVRILKCLRDELVELGHLRKGQIPSFLVECLVHAVPDAVFHLGDDRYDRVRNLLVALDTALSDQQYCFGVREVNGVKPLFAPFLGRSQPWRVDDARVFIAAAWKRMEA